MFGPRFRESVLMGCRRGQWASVQYSLSCLPGICLTGSDHLNPPAGHTPDKAVAATGCYKYIGGLQGVFVAAKLVNGHFPGKIQPVDFGGSAFSVVGIEKKAPCLSGMTGNGFEVLAGNGDFHVMPLAVIGGNNNPRQI